MVSVEDEIPCTAIENDWGDERPNILMHPQCQCPRCKAAEVELQNDGEGWLRMSGTRQRLRVEAVELGQTGTEALG